MVAKADWPSNERTETHSSRDLLVGFENDSGLEAFLKDEGYILEMERDGAKIYKPKQGAWPTVNCARADYEEGCDPDWAEAVFDVNYEANIVFPLRDMKATDEAYRLMKQMVNNHGGIFYDFDAGEFFRKGEL